MTITLCGLFRMASPGLAQNITATGNWFLTINAANLLSGAGSDLQAVYQSADNQVTIDVTKVSKDWSVTIQSVPSYWHADLSLYVRRRSDGSGPGLISGGLAWQQVTAISQTFFEGNKRRIGIEIQYSLRGVSIHVPPDTYSCSVVYTVVAY